MISHTKFAASRPHARMDRVNGDLVEVVMMMIDIVIALTSSLTAFWVYFVTVHGGAELAPRYALLGVFCGVVFVRFGRSNGWYQLKRIVGPRDGLVFFPMAWTFAVLATVTVIFLLKVGEEFSRGWLVSFWLIGLASLTLVRAGAKAFIRSLQNRGALRRRTVVVGTGNRVKQLLEELKSKELATQYMVLSVFEESGDDGELEAMPQKVGQLTDYVMSNRVDLVILAVKPKDTQHYRALINQICDLPVDVLHISEPVLIPLASRSFDFIGRIPVLTAGKAPTHDWRFLIKRVIDVIVASSLLLLLSPLLLVVALAIKLTSKGPIIFRQQRFGFGGQPIEVFKFRSMYVDRQDVSGAQHTVRNDKRVTPIGCFIRSTSIDELPQLINVVRGEMSIIGPRAHPIAMKVGEQYYHVAIQRYASRHRMLPGITGWAQVNGSRGEITTIEQARRRVELDLFYIENWSLALDLQILAQTFPCVLKAENAY